MGVSFGALGNCARGGGGGGRSAAAAAAWKGEFGSDLVMAASSLLAAVQAQAGGL